MRQTDQKRQIDEAKNDVAANTLKVTKLGEIIDGQGQRLDGRLTELLRVSIAQAHAEGMLAGTKDEQARIPDPKKTRTPEERLEQLRGQE